MPGQRFSSKANNIFRVSTVEDITKEVLISFVERYQAEQLPRLKELMDYYMNNTNINDREPRDSTRADNRLSHNFARYITTLIQGYILGKPITYNHENEPMLQQINDFNDFNDEQSHNALLELNLSIYGRAFEFVYLDAESNERIAVLDPRETFVIYDTTVEKKPVAGVRVYSIELTEDKVKTFVELYTEKDVIRYETEKEVTDIEQVEEKAHYFDGVPVIEYWNNNQRVGDFENVMDQIDAYDKSQSDTANEQEDFADAYLVLQGQPNTDSDDVNAMKEARVIVLDEATTEGSKPSAYYLVKQYDVAGVEAYKDRLVSDIHKLSFTPDLSDSEFAGNISGEAMKYKLFLLDQLRATKERLFKKGIMQRLRLLAKVWSIKNKENGIEAIEIQFTPNLPANTKELVEVAKQLEGIVSKQTQLGMLPMVEDIDAEQQRLNEEKEEAIQEFQQQPFGQGVTDGDE
jgi:SPP1 family phage portal protein